jgi:hypothetical protein
MPSFTYNFCLGIVVFFACANVAVAAVVSVVNSNKCTIEFSGQIEHGDASKFEQALVEIAGAEEQKNLGQVVSRYTPTLCLNSPGGSFAEAVEIINKFPDNLRTLIRADHECLSACALIFLAGRMFAGLPATREQDGWGSLPDRWLSVSGNLGFHAPYSPVDGPGERAFLAGVRAVAKLVAETAKEEGARFFPPDLLAKALTVGPDEYFRIERVFQVVHWNIRLADFPVKESLLTKCSMARACENYVWSKVIGVDIGLQNFENDVKDDSGGLKDKTELVSYKNPHDSIRMKNGVYVSPKFTLDLRRRGTYICIAQLYRSQVNGLLFELAYGSDDSKISLKKDALSIEESWQGKLAGKNLALLLTPSAKISDLTTSYGNRAFACSQEAGE